MANMNPEDFERISRILAIRLDNIGDIVMLSPALRALRQKFPAASITLMASPVGAKASVLLPTIDKVIPWRAVWQDISGNFSGTVDQEFDFIHVLRSLEFDAAFIFTSFSQSPYPPAYACYLADIKIRAGQSKEFGGNLLTHWVKPQSDSTYQVDRNLFFLSSLGIPVIDDHIELSISETDNELAGQILKNVGIEKDEPFILAAPGASASARRYHTGRLVGIINALSKETGKKVVIIGTDRENNLIEPFVILARRNKKIIPLVGQTSIPEYAAIIQRASLVLSNNSASIHLAEASHRPMVIFYSGSDYLSQWAPRYSPARIFNKPVSCSPCYKFQCPYNLECLDIPVSEAVSQILLFLDELNGDSHHIQESSFSIGDIL
jgi:ADP-heptose:LPS heptosyltransferase